MAIILGQSPIAIPHGNTKALPVGLDLHRLNNVEIKVLIHLDDIIHDLSPQRL